MVVLRQDIICIFLHWTHHYWKGSSLVTADIWPWQSKRCVFWLGKDRVASGCRQHRVHLKLRIQSALSAPHLSSLSLSFSICALSTLKSFLGDCAVNLSQTFITATWPGRIMYSSTGCAVLHTLLIFIRVRGVGGVSWGGWKSGRVVWLQGGSIWIFHCFQQFLQVQYKWHLMDAPSLSQPMLPHCSSRVARYFLCKTPMEWVKLLIRFFQYEPRLVSHHF